MRSMSLQATVRMAMIGAGLGSGLAVAAIIGAYRAVEHEHGRMEFAVSLYSNVGKLNLLTTELSVQPSPRARHQWNRQWEIVYGEFQKAQPLGGGATVLADEVIRRLETTKKLIDRVGPVPADASGQAQEARELLFSSAIAHIGAMMSRTREFYETRVASLKATRGHVFLSIGLFALVAIIGGGFILFWLCNSMLSRILQMRAAIQEISRGNLEAVLPAVPKDEVGDVFHELDQMRHSLLYSMGELSRVNLELTIVKGKLEERVAARTAQLEAANRDLESFTYAVSHDLRAPLRAISGFSRVVLDDYGGRLDAEGKDLLTRIVRATQNMNQLIEDLLKISRLNQSPLTLRDANLTRIVTNIVSSLRELSPGREVAVVIEEGVTAHCDEGMIGVALTNLLENAWKFTATTPQARIEFGQCKDAASPTFFVRDNGAGFDMASKDKLFKPFQRLHSASEFPGTGIGLATVDRVVKLHSGKAWAESAPGQGATFYIQLGTASGETDAPGESGAGQLPLRQTA
jgi:signal transduction histidine kinase